METIHRYQSDWDIELAARQGQTDSENRSPFWIQKIMALTQKERTKKRKKLERKFRECYSERK